MVNYGNMDTINIPPMLAYIPAPWILWVMITLVGKHESFHSQSSARSDSW